MISKNLSNLRVLKVFIASPADLADERMRAHEVVDEINRSFARVMGVYVDLLGWEDTQPGAGRPQELINRDVEGCHLFVGLLWKRWGTPTGGGFTSGFEEEFELATRNFRASSVPEIWLAFKQVDPALLADPGPQLSKVIEFKEAQKAIQTVLYKEFDDVTQWERLFRNWLTTHLATMINEISGLQAGAPVAERSTPSVSLTTTAADLSDKPNTPAAIQSFFSELVNVLGGTSIHTEDLLSDIPDADIARVHLLSKAWMTANVTSEVLTPHEANYFFANRESLSPIIQELHLLFRSVIADGGNVVPGWYWRRRQDTDKVIDAIFSLAESDPLALLRISAITVLGNADIHPNREQISRLIAVLVDKEQEREVRTAIVEYLGRTGVEAALATIDSLADGGVSDIQDAARRAREELLVGSFPGKVLETFEGSPFDSESRVYAKLSRRVDQVSEESLRIGLASRHNRIRELAASELSRRDMLGAEDASGLLADPALKVREIALSRLIALGKPVEIQQIRSLLNRPPTTLIGTLRDDVDADRTVEERLNHLSDEELDAMIEWQSLEGPIAYKVLGIRRSPEITDTIRADLSDGFQRLKNRFSTRLNGLFGAAADEVLGNWKQHDEMLEAMFTGAALAVLRTAGTSADIKFARDALANTNQRFMSLVADAAIGLIRRFGDTNDAQALMAVAESNYGALRISAVETAIELSSNDESMIKRLIESSDADFVRIWIQSIPKTVDADERIFPLLDNDRDTVRAAAVNYFIERYSSSELERLLTAYQRKRSYYYNVVCWLDRILFAPEPLRSYYRNKLNDT